MAPPEFRSRAHSRLTTLLQRILDRLHADLPEALGLAIVVQDTVRTGTPVVVAGKGIEPEMVASQLGGCGGPLVDALQYDVPVISLHVFSDDRWPALTRDAFAADHRAHDTDLDDVVGAAALPGLWGHDSAVVLTCTLSQPATATTITTLIGYEQLVAAALVIDTADADVHDALQMMQSRSAIEQAKGVVMGRLRCDADHAWATLRTASQTLNVKVRDLAVALLEHIRAPADDATATLSPAVVDERSRIAARELWVALDGFGD